MSVDQSRQPTGAPIGGQFAATTHAETGLALTPDTVTAAHVCSVCSHRIAHRDGTWVHAPNQDHQWSPIHDGDPLCDGAGPQELPPHMDELARAIEDRGIFGGPVLPEAERLLADTLAGAREIDPDIPEEYVAELLTLDGALRNIARNDGILSSWSDQARGAEIAAAHLAGMPADWPVQMAARGEMWPDHCVKAWTEGITEAELARLDVAGLATSPILARAYIGADTDEVNRWLTAAREDKDLSGYLARYLSHRGIGRYVNAGVPLDDVRLSHQLGLEPSTALHGITVDGQKVTGPAALRQVADYMKASKLGQDETVDALKAGIPAALGKEFGPRFTADEMRDLSTAAVPGIVARSLRARDREMSPTTMARAHAAGISTGADWKAWQGVATTTRTTMYSGQERRYHEQVIWDLNAVGVSLKDAARLRSQNIPHGAVAPLATAGITDWAPWGSGVNQRAQTTIDTRDQTVALTQIAEFARAGGTPDQFARAQKAGVPLVDLPKHVTSTPKQLWKAGAANRDAVLADEKRRHDTWGSMAHAPEPWPVTGPEQL